ncbi:MAG: hypothetical protein H7234_03360 [Herminiimonas sp.]|nr:hypothetical protein [Herminiimonas sp.]
MSSYLRVFTAFATAILLSCMASTAHADDIDIFGGSSGGAGAATNVLLVLDNTSNWSANNQGWPGGITQGQAEVQSIKQLVTSLNGNATVNLGLMVMTTVSGNPGGMIVFPAAPITALNVGAWTSWLDARYNNITDSNWKAPSNANYGAAMFDVFKYFGGYANPTQAAAGLPGTPVDRTHFGPVHYATIDTSIANPAAYTSDFVSYVPPAQSSCGKNYVIFIGNGFPNDDDTTLLANVGGDASPILLNPMDGGSRVYAADEWARFLAGADASAFFGTQSIITYTINVFGPSAGPTQPKQAQYLANMARAGGGRYFTAQSSTDVTAALQQTVAEILAVNDNFASASLPVNTANRSQDKNQVFIPMFRPDPNGQPRWMGNLKQYQLIDVAGATVLGDANGLEAINPQTGFLTDCATSFWTINTGAYWSTVPETPAPRGKCPNTLYSPFSDAPDGPIVEKGGVGEILRNGNNPPTTSATPTYQVNRTLYTISAGALAPFSTATSGLSASVVDFISGKDTQDENGNGNLTEARPSIHGDAIHSRPLPVDYGNAGVTVFYGANDGTFRAVDSTTGRERWALIAPEFFTGNRLARLQANSPKLSNYISLLSTVTPTPTPKDYFFDGSIGVYQAAQNTAVWIYPTTRRGARMLYALDVTNPSSPSFKWKFGCPNLTDDSGCSAGATGIGQTWSKPMVAGSIAGYNRPVVIVGGGYDGCEDANMSLPLCIAEKGAAVYVLDANDGTLLKTFPTPRAVVADIALYSSRSNGVVDTAYAVDTGGNISRIDFKPALADATMNRIAYSNNSGRKFLYAPALLNGPATTAGVPSRTVYLALGSGDREHPLSSQYTFSTVTNRFYVFIDNLDATTALNLDDTSLMTNNTNTNSCSAAEVLPTSTSRGYFLNLNQNGTGEQTVTTALIISGLVSFSTNRAIPAAQGTCSTTLGEARGYWLNLFNGAGAVGVSGACGGARSSTFVGGGLPPSPVVGIVPVNAVVNGVRVTGQLRTVVIGAVQRAGGASTTISPQEIKPLIRSKRKTIYWRSTGID